MNSLFPPLPRHPKPRAYRLGVSSYVYPADLKANVEALAPYVDDIELLLLESQSQPGAADQAPISISSNIPSPDVIQRLAALAQQHGLTYTVHLPLDRQLGSPESQERLALQKQMLAIIERTAPLRPFAYILHLEGVSADSAPARILAWQSDIAELLPELIARVGDPALLCVENLFYPFAWCQELLDAFGLGVCIDLGHLWVGGEDAEEHLKRHLSRTRVIHLHGVKDGKDHLGLGALPPERLRWVLNALAEFKGVLTLEIFNYEGVRDSLILLVELWQQNRKPRAS